MCCSEQNPGRAPFDYAQDRKARPYKNRKADPSGTRRGACVGMTSSLSFAAGATERSWRSMRRKESDAEDGGFEQSAGWSKGIV